MSRLEWADWTEKQLRLDKDEQFLRWSRENPDDYKTLRQATHEAGLEEELWLGGCIFTSDHFLATTPRPWDPDAAEKLKDSIWWDEIEAQTRSS